VSQVSKGKLLFYAAVVTIAGLGSTYRLTQFVATILKEELTGFGVISIATYLLGVIAILFLTLWALCKGHFRNLEAPKYRMMELNDEIDRLGNRTQA
jgi:hypothetical protein